MDYRSRDQIISKESSLYSAYLRVRRHVEAKFGVQVWEPGPQVWLIKTISPPNSGVLTMVET